MFSEIFRINKNLCHLSNDGNFLAIAFQSNLIVKYSKNCETIHSFMFPDIIEVRILFVYVCIYIIMLLYIFKSGLFAK